MNETKAEVINCDTCGNAGMLLVPCLHVPHVFVRDVLQLRDHKLCKTAADAFKLQLRMLHNSRQDRKQDFEITHSLVLRHNDSVGEHLRKVAQIALEQSDFEPQPFVDDGFADVRGNRGEICGEREVTARAAPTNKNMRPTPASTKLDLTQETMHCRRQKVRVNMLRIIIRACERR